ncbi:MAG: FecR family protein [Trueperaceae bacterium]
MLERFSLGVVCLVVDVCLVVLIFMAVGYVSAQTLTTVNGVVEIRETVDDPWRPASAGDVLQARGSVRTLQGDLTLTLETGGFIRLSTDSEMIRGLRTYELVLGKAYTQGEAVPFEISGPMRVSGEARFDVDSTSGARAVLLSGTAHLTFEGRVLELELGQQLVIPLEGEPSFSEYFERDPWYKDLVVLEEGTGVVENFLGEANIQNAEGGWRAAQLEDVLAAGDAARTGAASWLEFRFSDNTLLRLQEDSEIVLKNLESYEDGSRRTVVELRKGKVWAVVEEGSPFEIETPGLVAGVRGTKFRVDAAADDAPALLKTFEGEVAGIAGFEVFEVSDGKQLDLDAGVGTLQKDALDEFNLARDLLVNAPKLRSEFPAFTDEAVLDLKGSVDEGSIVTTFVDIRQETFTATDGTFAEDVPLKTGVNIVGASAVFVEGGKRSSIIKPVIRSGYDIFFLVNEPELISDTVVKLSGFVNPGSGLFARSAVTAYTSSLPQGYFTIFLPIGADNNVSLELTTPLGDTREQTLTVPR